MFQTGHCRENNVYDRIQVAYNKTPTKPVLDGEPIYEDHPVCFNAADLGTSNAYDVRRSAYLDVFSGACGHTYGCHDMWQFYAANRTPVNGPKNFWYVALDLPGATQMKYLRNLIESRPMLDRVPDQTIITNALDANDRIQATRGKDYLFVYTTQGKPITVNMGKITGTDVVAYWYNPKNGQFQEIGHFKNSGQQTFTPSSNGYGQDWVLVVDDVSKHYAMPK